MMGDWNEIPLYDGIISNGVKIYKTNVSYSNTDYSQIIGATSNPFSCRYTKTGKTVALQMLFAMPHNSVDTYEIIIEFFGSYQNILQSYLSLKTALSTFDDHTYGTFWAFGLNTSYFSNGIISNIFGNGSLFRLYPKIYYNVTTGLTPIRTGATGDIQVHVNMVYESIY